MKTIDISVLRVGLLIKRFVVMYSRPVLLAVGGLSSFLFMVVVLTAIGGPVQSVAFNAICLTFLLIGGYLFSSTVFPELNSETRGSFFLTLPVSSTDRLLYGWLLSGPIYALFSWLLMVLIGLLLALVQVVVFRYEFRIPDIWSESVFRTLAVYLVTQTIFLTGSVYFKKFAFFKTLLSLFAFAMILGIYSTTLTAIVFGGRMNGNFSGQIVYNSDGTSLGDIISTGSKFIFWGLLAPFFLRVSYFRIKERQL